VLRRRHKIVPLSWIHCIFWSSALLYALRPKIQCICMLAAMLLTTMPKLLASLQQPRAKQIQKKKGGALVKVEGGQVEGGASSQAGGRAGGRAGGQARDWVARVGGSRLWCF
jgi:hypothetical protein